MGSIQIGAFGPWRRCRAGDAGIANLTPAGNFETLRGGWAALCSPTITAGADPPHKGQTCAVRLDRRLDLFFISFRRGGEMCLVLFLFWCSAVVGRCVRSNILPDTSRLGRFNSRLGPREFPVCIATGIRSQALDLAPRFPHQMAILSGKSTKFAFRREKPGILLRSAGRAAARLPYRRPRGFLPLRIEILTQ
jgi:hypothetical protein